MNEKRNWQNLQLSMNNFHINKLMSYTDIKNKLKAALDNADKQNSNYHYAERISNLINNLDNKDDFVLNNTNNQGLFSQISICMSSLIGSNDIKSPTIHKVNQLLNNVRQKNPSYFKKFNLTIHKQGHMSGQQAMIQIMKSEAQEMNKDSKEKENKK